MKSVIIFAVVFLLALIGSYVCLSYMMQDLYEAMPGASFSEKASLDNFGSTADNYDDAIQKAKESDKLVFLYFGAKWCRYCTLMKKDVLSEKSVFKKLNDVSVIYLVDLDMDVGKELAAKYRINGIPVCSLIDEDGVEIAQNLGYTHIDSFKEWLDKSLKENDASKSN